MRTSNIDTSNGYVINIKHAIQPPKVQAVQTEKQNIKTQNHTIINQIIKPKTTQDFFFTFIVVLTKHLAIKQIILWKFEKIKQSHKTNPREQQCHHLPLITTKQLKKDSTKQIEIKEKTN